MEQSVLWKISPLVAEWLSSKENLLWTSWALNDDSAIVELGCGISGLIALSLAPSIGLYILTDQVYIRKLLEKNLKSNFAPAPTIHQPNKRHSCRSRRPRKPNYLQQHSLSSACAGEEIKSKGLGNIIFAPLDWELDSSSRLKEILTLRKLKSRCDSDHLISTPSKPPVDNDSGFDILLACDCIYNDALISPFVQTCVDICRFRPTFAQPESNADQVESLMISESPLKPTLCIISQQLRSPDVFENWLRESMVEFHVWRVKDEVLGKDLRGGSGYVVHMLLLREGRGYKEA